MSAVFPRCEVLWFEQPASQGKMNLMVPLRDIPVCIARGVVELMAAQGLRFVQPGSTELPEVKL